MKKTKLFMKENNKILILCQEIFEYLFEKLHGIVERFYVKGTMLKELHAKIGLCLC